MIIEGLKFELEYEGENTRKLLKAIPNELLAYKPTEFYWPLADLASHIAEIYNWWTFILEQDHFEFSTYKYSKEDNSNIENIIERFEQNLARTQKALENYPIEKMYETWRMTKDGIDVFPPSKRVGVIRSWLMSHLYHHRGEVVAFLRVNRRIVPALYGPTYEAWNGIQ